MSALSIYDNLNGSVLVTWPPSPGIAPQSFNVYLNGVLNQNVVAGGAPLLTELGQFLETEAGQMILAELAAGTVAGAAVITGLQTASYNAAAIAAPGNGSTRPESLPPVGVITDSLTYAIRVVPVVGGVEAASAMDGVVTPGPTSVILKTPMARGPFPFPSTPGGF